MSNNPQINLIEELFDCIENYGIKTTISILRNAKQFDFNDLNVKSKFVIDVVCRTFKITEKELLLDRNNSGIRTDALATSAFILYTYFDLTHLAIGKILIKERSQITKYISRIKGLDKMHPEDKKLIDKIDLIIKKIELANTKNLNNEQENL
jgi:lysyl-tRNA synthetase class II